MFGFIRMSSSFLKWLYYFTLTSNGWVFQLPHILANICYYLFFPLCSAWHDVISVTNSLMTNDIGYLFICLLATRIFFFCEVCFHVLPIFNCCGFFFLLLSCSSLDILDANLLSDICITNIVLAFLFSHGVFWWSFY